MTYMKEIPFQNGGYGGAMVPPKTLSGCGLCGAEAVFLCSGCRRVRFCSFQCQQKMWKEHRRQCQGATQVRPNANGAAKTAQADASWLVIFNTDALPGRDAGAVTTGPEAAKEVCVQKGFGGMVVWQNTFYFRQEPVGELVADMQHAQGTHLWLPVAPLLESLPPKLTPTKKELPEVVVEGARMVKKCRALTTNEMDANFRAGTPVVLTDAQQGWPAKDKWTFQWMASNYGDEMMPCSDLAPFFRHVDRGQIRTVQAPLREFVRYVEGEPSVFYALQQREDRIFYANGWAPFLEKPELLSDVSDRLYCVSDAVPKGKGPAEVFNASLTKIFMGPAGTVSRLHHDTYATHVWLSQIRGRKQFICYPPEDTENLHSLPVDEVEGRTSLFDPEAPDFQRFPKAKRAQAYSVVVEEGETVILPARWWHWAKSLTPSITLMRNFVNQSNLQDHIAIRQRAEKMKAQKATAGQS